MRGCWSGCRSMPTFKSRCYQTMSGLKTKGRTVVKGKHIDTHTQTKNNPSSWFAIQVLRMDLLCVQCVCVCKKEISLCVSVCVCVCACFLCVCMKKSEYILCALAYMFYVILKDCVCVCFCAVLLRGMSCFCGPCSVWCVICLPED